MNKTIRWHIGVWLVYFFISYFQDILYEDWTFAVSFYNVASFSLIVIAFYIFYLIVAPNFLKPGRYFYIPLFLFLFIGMKYFVQELLTPWIFGSSNSFESTFLEYIDANLFLAFVPAAAGSLLYMFEQRKKNEANALRLLNERNEAELAFLRTQINPHFLFNTMSFLHTKAFKLDEELATSILRLSDVMRYTLKNSESASITVQEEINLVQDLIDIYRDRFGEKCFVNLEMKGDGFNQKFEPLILMPFVENAFKHGVYNDPDHPVLFKLDLKQGHLVFSISNEIKHQKKDEVSGIGITNLRRRLNLMYPNKHQLDIRNDGKTYFAELKIDL